MKPYFQSFGFKLFVFIGVALTLLVLNATYYNIKVQEQQLIDEVLTGADNIAQTVKYVTRTYMLENRKEKVQETIVYIAEKTEGIERLRLFDKKGKIRKSTLPEERGKVFGKNAEQCAMCHSEGKPLEALERRRRIRITPSEDGGHRAVSLTYAIYNEKSCYAQCHDAHPKSRKVLGVFDITMSLRDVDKKIAGNRRYLIRFNVAAFLLIMTPLGAMLFFFLIRPMNALLRGIKDVSHGNFKTEIPVYTNDEFGRLSKSFNVMLKKLRREIEYGNLLMYDSAAIKSKAGGAGAGEKIAPNHKKQAEQGTTFEEIYDRIKDETHLKLVRSVKLASLGQLSAGIAHEINNPLTAVLSYSSLLLDKIDSPKEKAWLETIVEETKRCRNIVAGLLEFSRQTTPEKVPTNINDIVERAVGLLKNQESFHNITIEKNLAPDLPQVRVDRGQLYQVFMNLMINASDATSTKGTLTIESRLNVVKSTFAEDRRFVEVSLADTGCGISGENLERIFDPFFTTKGPTVGTGLGLSICYGIVRRHNGNITVKSRLCEGTTFTISLPVEEEA